MAFPYATKEAYELAGVPKEIDEAGLQQYKTAGKYVGDGTCIICAQEYFVDPIHPVLLHSDGSETLHIICEDCYTTHYNDNDEESHNQCPYCRLELFLLSVDDDVVRPLTADDHIRLTRFRFEQIQRGDRHENHDLLDDRILSSDLRYLGRQHNQDGDLWWRHPLHAVDEQALRTVLEHRAAVYMDGELDLSLSMYDAAYEDGDDTPRVRMRDSPLNGTYTLQHILDVEEITMSLRDAYYRRFLSANVNGSRGMVTHPLAMQALRVIETTLRNERSNSQYHRPSTIYTTLCAELRKSQMAKVPQTCCGLPDCSCAETNERRVQGLETVVADMVTTVINVLRTAAAKEALNPVTVTVTRRSAGEPRRESKRRLRHNHQVSPSR